MKADAIFKNRWQQVAAKVDRKGHQTEPERSFVTTFSAREFIADNVAMGKAWYQDITSYISRRQTREQLLYERKELNVMVRTASFDEESERLFIDVCHESWRRRLGKLGQRALSEKNSFPALANKEAERLRSSLVRCKNAESLRETVVDFWSRAGANRSLRGSSLTRLLRLFDENNWKKARDLALLSLISYEPQNQQEEAALSETVIDEGDKDE
jgi:CRISPR-associated protein Cas8a1/Csx13